MIEHPGVAPEFGFSVTSVVGEIDSGLATIVIGFIFIILYNGKGLFKKVKLNFNLVIE